MKKIELSASVHLAFYQLELGGLTFGLPIGSNPLTRERWGLLLGCWGVENQSLTRRPTDDRRSGSGEPAAPPHAPLKIP